MSGDTTPLDRCLACGSRHLVPYLDLGAQPLANAYRKIGDATPLARYPLELRFCATCSHSQLSLSVSREAIFRDYLYVSGTTKTFREHCDAFADEAVARWRFSARAWLPGVVDLACNDGTLLAAFRDRHGADVFGVDPALNLLAESEAKGLAVLPEFFGSRVVTAEVLRRLGRVHPDVVTASNVLGHVPDPLAFLRECHALVRRDGLVVVEVPWSGSIVTQGQFDQVYHEHLSYFTARSFRTLAERAGFEVQHVTRTSIHGGSLRFFLSKALGCDETCSVVEVEERSLGLHDRSGYAFLWRFVEEQGGVFRERILAAREEGRSVVGYGASAKGATALGAFRVDLERIYDDNPKKHGHQTPHGVPIAPPGELAHEPRPVTVVVMAWNFLDEVRERIVALRGPGRGDRLLLYSPNVHEVPIA